MQIPKKLIVSAPLRETARHDACHVPWKDGSPSVTPLNKKEHKQQFAVQLIGKLHGDSCFAGLLCLRQTVHVRLSKHTEALGAAPETAQTKVDAADGQV